MRLVVWGVLRNAAWLPRLAFSGGCLEFVCCGLEGPIVVWRDPTISHKARAFLRFQLLCVILQLC